MELEQTGSISLCAGLNFININIYIIQVQEYSVYMSYYIIVKLSLRIQNVQPVRCRLLFRFRSLVQLFVKGNGPGKQLRNYIGIAVGRGAPVLQPTLTLLTN